MQGETHTRTESYIVHTRWLSRSLSMYFNFTLHTIGFSLFIVCTIQFTLYTESANTLYIAISTLDSCAHFLILCCCFFFFFLNSNETILTHHKAENRFLYSSNVHMDIALNFGGNSRTVVCSMQYALPSISQI